MADIEATLRQMSNENTAKTFAFNSYEAQKARDFQERMSDTSHQREVEDLKRAGLNPVLSANSGAQSYSASSASGQSDNSAVGLLASIYQTKLNNQNAVKIAKLQKAEDVKIAKINAQAAKYASDNSSSASRYATENSKYGMINNFIDSLADAFLGNSNNSGRNTSNNKGVKKAGSVIKNGLKGREKYTLTGRIISKIGKRYK